MAGLLEMFLIVLVAVVLAIVADLGGKALDEHLHPTMAPVDRRNARRH